ncbi:MAG: carboxypeptidase-like regulatory domain-containing protein [Cyclobacteriaceae bacterium]
MKKFTATAFLSTLLIGVLSYCHSFGQANQIVLTGKVFDKATQEPLPYATVSIKRKSIGVVTNPLGEFTFNFADQYLNDTLMISMMGYETYMSVIKNLEDRDRLFFQLELKTTILNEVVITDKELTPKEIVERAIDNVKFNYPQEPYLLDGFYRDFKRENEKYVALLEAAISIYDKGYSVPRPKQRRQLQENVFINEIRKSKTVEYKAKIYTNLNLLDGLMISNDVRYINFALDVPTKKYELEKYVYQGEQLVYVIKTNYPWLSRIFIDADTFAILKIEMDARWEGVEKNEWKMNDSIMNRTSYIKKTVKFKKYEGKYFLEYMNYSWRIEGFKKGSDKILFTSDFYQELLVNNVISQNIRKPALENRMNADKVLELQTKPYNENFWKTYNIIQESPLNKRIIKDLDEAEVLEEQFKKGGLPEGAKETKRKRKN